jgi:hypothetical protein
MVIQRLFSKIKQLGTMLKQARMVVFLVAGFVLIAGCKTSQKLSFDISLSYVALEAERFSEKAPNIIVITSSDEIVPPAKGITYPKVAMDLLTSLDYNKSIAVLFIVGQVNNDVIINEVIREKGIVTIDLNNYSIGPGNYIPPGFTLPYQMIVIEKSGNWSDNIHFEIKVNHTDIIAGIDHYVP